MDWGAIAGLSINLTALLPEGAASFGSAALASTDMAAAGNWSGYWSFAEDYAHAASDYFNDTALDFSTNYTANQTEWATFLAQCYGGLVGKAGLVAAGSSAACAFLPITCIPIGAYSLFHDAQMAATLYSSGIDGVDPCAEVRNAYPAEAASLVSQRVAAAASSAGAAPLAGALTTCGLLFVLLASVLTHRRPQSAAQDKLLV